MLFHCRMQASNAWKSQITERCHACGHDGHQTWLLAVADYLHSHNDFPGRVVCIFQAAEESVSGAKSVVESGIFQKYDIQEVYGAHNEPFLDLGSIGFKIGALMASADYFKISLFGKGTHGARPHLGIAYFPGGKPKFIRLSKPSFLAMSSLWNLSFCPSVP